MMQFTKLKLHLETFIFIVDLNKQGLARILQDPL